MSSSSAPIRTPDDERRIKAAEFAWDLALQLAALREARGLSQVQLAELIGTKQQAVSRMENPTYDRQNLAKLREVAKALHAFVDVVLVPEEKASVYTEYRYQPVLDEEPPFRWETLSGEPVSSLTAPAVEREVPAPTWQLPTYSWTRAQTITSATEPERSEAEGSDAKPLEKVA